MKRNILQKLGDFVLGKGFYIVLFLCVAAIGISGYYLIRSVTGDSSPSEPVTGNPSITLPDSSAETPPQSQPLEEAPASQPPLEDAVQEDDPQPVKEPVEEEAAAAPETVDVVYSWPVKGQVLRSFSVETLAYDATMGDWRTHSGVDIAAEAGLKVLAAGDGQRRAMGAPPPKPPPPCQRHAGAVQRFGGQPDRKARLSGRRSSADGDGF